MGQGEIRETVQHGAVLTVVPLVCCPLCGRMTGVLSYVTGIILVPGPEFGDVVLQELGRRMDMVN